ncbi:MAG: cyclic-di-AMP receptor [Chloroflexi bacterium]|nr:cyclic-di-AMP receptor [Chloroflexota bacterium]
MAASIDDVQRLIFAVVHRDDADGVTQALVESGYRATRIDAQGGFLRRGNAVFMVGVAAEQVDDVIQRVRGAAHRASGQSKGGSSYGIVFVVRVDAFARL